MKKGLKLAIVLTLTFVLCISFAACDGETLESLKNEYGILVEGGGFKEGSTLVSKVIELVSDEGKEALEAIKNLEYNKDGKIHIYDISVVLDGVEVQPDGKVKVTLPAPDDGVDNYDVFHIKDSGIAEKLVATLLDGKVIFETDSFSMFVVVEGVKHSFFANCIPDDGGYITENGEKVEFDGERLVADGTQITLTAVANADYTFKGWYYYDKNQVETLISTDATHTFTITEPLSTYAKFEEKEKHSFFAKCTPDDGGYITENGEKVEFDGERMVADGTQITLTAVANTGYTFKGWYYYDKNQVETLISADATHTFTVTEPLSTYAKFEEKTMYTFLAQCDPTDGGYIIENEKEVDFGNGRMVDPGTQITLTAVANKGFVFVGWGTRDDDWNLTIISADATHTFVVTESTYVQAVFEEEPNGLKLDAHNAGFTYDEKDEPTTTIYRIGSEFQPDAQNVLVYATYPTQEDKYLTLNEDYTIDLGGLDFAKIGTYTITFTHKADNSLQATLTVQVVDKDYHEHTFSREWSSNETHHWHAATCGHDVKADYAEHYYSGSWDVIKPATETEVGDKVRVCIGCKYEDHAEIPKLEHVHTFSKDWTSNGEYHWHEATCSHTSEVDGKELCSGGSATCTQKAICSICGKEYGDLLNHDFTKKVIDEKYLATPATCLEHATYYYSCSVCEAKGTETFEDTSGKLAYCNYNEADVCTVCEVPASAWLKFTAIKESNEIVAYKVSGFVSSYNSRKTEYVRVPSTYNDKPVIEIGENALYFSNIRHVVLPDSIVTLGNNIPLPQHIETLVIGSGLKNIAHDSFGFWNGGCTELRQITISEDNPYFKMVDGVMYSKDGKTLVKYPALTEGEEFVIGSNVEKIWSYAFSYTVNLKSVVIPDSVTEILEYAFLHSNMTSVDIGSGVETISDAAFNSTCLKAVVLEGNIKTICEGAFAFSSYLKSVSFGEKVETIGKAAFKSTALTEIIIPDNVTSLGESAFENTGTATKVVIGSGITEIPNEAFRGSLCGSNPTLVIGSNVKTIGNSAFLGMRITSLDIPASVTTIGSSAFEYCEKLTSLVIPDTVKSIGTVCFSGCKSLESVTLNNVLTEIPASMFAKCSSLKSITIPNCVKTIGGGAFFACTSLDTVNFGTGLTSIGERAFENCYALTSITIPDGVETIEHEAFKGCSALKTVVLPGSIHKISTATFKNCKVLESVTFTGSEPKVLYFKYDPVYSYTFDTVEKTTDMLSYKVLTETAYLYTVAAFNIDNKYHPITEGETKIVRWEDRETE